MAKTFIVRILAAAMLLNVAIATGVCAVLCQVHACDPAKATPPRCPHCAPLPATAQFAEFALLPDCCAWMRSKVDQPATLTSRVRAPYSGIAVIPARPFLPETASFHRTPSPILYESRAPPGRRFQVPQPRAPPVDC